MVLGVSRTRSARSPLRTASTRSSFPLLSDADHAVAEAYGVWVEKSMYGRKFMGMARRRS